MLAAEERGVAVVGDACSWGSGWGPWGRPGTWGGVLAARGTQLYEMAGGQASSSVIAHSTEGVL